MVKSRRIGDRAFDWILNVVMCLIAFLSIAPVLHIVSVSLSDSAKVSAGYITVWPVDITFVAYKKLLYDHQFFVSALVSFERVATLVPLSLLLTLLLAFPLSRETKQFRQRNIYMWTLIVVMLFNGGLIPTYLVIKSYGMLDTFWVLFLPGAVNVFNAILVFNFFRNLPKELDDSSSLEGAGPWRKLFYIYVPLSIPVLATITLFNVVNVWNDYFTGMIYISSSHLIPLQTYMQSLIVQIDPNQLLSNLNPDQMQNVTDLSNQTLSAAKMVATMLPILVLYPFLQRYFIHGITLGSVKE